MATICQTETQEALRSGRINLLPSMRNDQCTLVWPSAQETPYKHGSGAIDSGASLHDESERPRRMPSGSGTFSNDVRGDNGTFDDPFSGPAEPVVYPEGCESSEARTWYLIGRSEGMEQQFKNLLPAIDQAIEIAMR